MEIKKDYFPRAKAPEIAKKKVMQYVYWSKKNLSKRFYFYRVYAPAFLLLFIVWWWLAFYDKQIKPNWEIYTFKSESWMEGGFIENSNESQNIAGLAGPSSVNNDTLMRDASALDSTSLVSPALNPSQDNFDQTSSTTSIARSNTTETKSSNIFPVNGAIDGPSSVSSVSPEATLDQQITEIENLMNDISSITTQEENLF